MALSLVDVANVRVTPFWGVNFCGELVLIVKPWSTCVKMWNSPDSGFEFFMLSK